MESGIYLYKNLLDGKKYVGQSRNIKRRCSQHENCFLLDSEEKLNKKDNILLWRAVKKHGRENFVFEILEYSDFEKLNDLEAYYIKKLNSHFSFWGYNITWGGNNLSGEEHPFYGKHHSPENIEIIRSCAKKRKPMKHTDESKKKISDQRKLQNEKRRNDPENIARKEEKIKIVKELILKGYTTKEITEETGIASSTISKIRNNKY